MSAIGQATVNLSGAFTLITPVATGSRPHRWLNAGLCAAVRAAVVTAARWPSRASRRKALGVALHRNFERARASGSGSFACLGPPPGWAVLTSLHDSTPSPVVRYTSRVGVGGGVFGVEVFEFAVRGLGVERKDQDGTDGPGPTARYNKRAGECRCGRRARRRRRGRSRCPPATPDRCRRWRRRALRSGTARRRRRRARGWRRRRRSRRPPTTRTARRRRNRTSASVAPTPTKVATAPTRRRPRSASRPPTTMPMPPGSAVSTMKSEICAPLKPRSLRRNSFWNCDAGVANKRDSSADAGQQNEATAVRCAGPSTRWLPADRARRWADVAVRFLEARGRRRRASGMNSKGEQEQGTPRPVRQVGDREARTRRARRRRSPPMVIMLVAHARAPAGISSADHHAERDDARVGDAARQHLRAGERHRFGAERAERRQPAARRPCHCTISQRRPRRSASKARGSARQDVEAHRGQRDALRALVGAELLGGVRDGLGQQRRRRSRARRRHAEAGEGRRGASRRCMSGGNQNGGFVGRPIAPEVAGQRGPEQPAPVTEWRRALSTRCGDAMPPVAGRLGRHDPAGSARLARPTPRTRPVDSSSR